MSEDGFEEAGAGFENEDDDQSLNKNDIVFYLSDEHGNEIGYVYRLEGETYEYYYESPKRNDDDRSLNKNDIVYYIVDEDDNEIGYGYRLEGEIYEYYYPSYEANTSNYADDEDEELDSNGMYTYYEESDFW